MTTTHSNPERDAIHQDAIDRLCMVLFNTRMMCGNERAAILNWFCEESEEKNHFNPLEVEAIAFQATRECDKMMGQD
jgi:hypothetical protein